MSRFSLGIVAVGSLAALALGVGPGTVARAADPTPPPECAPNQTFSTDITNQYAPMQPDRFSTFFGIEGHKGVGLQIVVTGETAKFYEGEDDGIPTVTTAEVVETEWADKDADGVIDAKERTIEISHNYFAQTLSGTVCYFGEAVQIFKNGRFRGDTSGSWRADDTGNAPGIFMPADPQVNDTFLIEFAPGIAMDTATVQAFEDDKTVPAGTFDDAMRVQDCNPFDGDCDIKYYAPDTGLIVDGALELTNFDGR